MELKIVKDAKTLLIRTVTLAGGSAGGGGGWIYIEDVTVPGGTASSKVFQDAGNTVLQSAVVSSQTFNVLVRASYPIVKVNGVSATLSRAVSGGHYSGSVPVTLSGTTGVVSAIVELPDTGEGAADTCNITVSAPPQILTLQFIGGYPAGQTELKAGDTFAVTGTTDKPVDAIDILDFGAFAASLQIISIGTSFMVSGTIADRGTSVQALAARVRVRDAVTGAFSLTRDTNQGGGTVDGVNLVNLNNLYPTVTWGSPSYPGSQLALKASETATVPLTVANGNSIVIDSPNGDLSVTNPTTIEPVKTVQRIAGSYNVTTNNLRAVATRTANGATTTTQTIVNIAAVAAVITVIEPATRLRSGGNNGTAAQLHTITIASDQNLLSAPSMDPDTGGPRGTFTGPGFVGGPATWTRQLQVHDNDEKGTFGWANLAATNLAGLPTTTITGDGSYTLGGFVARSLTFPAFSQTTLMGVAVVDYSKLIAGIFTATNQPAVKTAAQGDVSNQLNRFTVTALGANPTTVFWNDAAAAASNSSGTAQITAVEESV